MTQLLHPEYFSSIPFNGRHIKQRFEELSENIRTESRESGEITVAIRTLNEAGRLAILLDDIKQQDFDGQVEVIVVDNESTDDTAMVAKEFGAKVISIPRNEFTYPRSMNLAMQEASNDTVFLTVGHAQLVSKQSLQSGYNNMKSENVGGVYGHALPSDNASITENIIGAGNIFFAKRQESTRAGLGFMAATGAMFSKALWDEHGRFDEAYERGGEDGRLGGKILESGYEIIDDPLLSTHHSHGLSFVNTIKQWNEWTKLAKASTLDRRELVKRRPDLRLDD